MRYAAERPTAMILPLPVALPAREDAVKFRSLKEYAELFTDLEAGFPSAEKSELDIGLRSRAATASAAPPLAVHVVGDFIASFVPNVGDFGRLDPRFVLSKDVWAKIPAYADYGFAVFQLASLAGSPHPIGFEFASRMRDSIFFPTVHIHDGAVHDTGDFDHALYLQHADLDARVGTSGAGYRGPEHVDPRSGFVRSRDRASTFVSAARAQGFVDPNQLVHRVRLLGSLPNKDMTYAFASERAAAAGGCAKCSVSRIEATPLGPAGAALAGLAWIIRRRQERGHRR